MASDNIGMAPKRIFIKLPKKYMAGLSLYYALDHGLFITGLNPNVSESHLATYFTEWGCITMCKIRNSSSSSKDKLAYVRFSKEDEANQADWAGPHFIFGEECKVIRVVSPKVSKICFPYESKVCIFHPLPCQLIKFCLVG
uniref:RRM domain-containing protein n=1 Tax=Poecilia mexicana TaxID=48701 RepID=A0A3B3XCF2_9TELE